MRGDGGFTLIETVVAVTIVSLVAIGVLGAFAAEQRSAVEARRAIEAVALAQDRLAHLALVGAEEFSPLADTLREGNFEPPYDSYRWTADVRRVREHESLYEATVSIEWGNGGRHATRTRLHRPTRPSATR